MAMQTARASRCNKLECSHTSRHRGGNKIALEELQRRMIENGRQADARVSAGADAGVRGRRRGEGQAICGPLLFHQGRVSLLPRHTEHRSSPVQASISCPDYSAVVRMDRLKVGDRVRTGAATYSDVHMFGHAKDGWFSFLNISTHCGACLVVSANHIIEVNGGELKSAGSVKVGDRTERGMVVSVSRVRAQGLYHPHTVDGMIVVDGFRATTYTSVMPMSVARVLLYPVQLVYRMCGVNVVGSFFHEDRAYLLKGPRLAKHVVKNLLQRLVRSNLSG